jgi:hypothetical protein
MHRRVHIQRRQKRRALEVRFRACDGKERIQQAILRRFRCAFEIENLDQGQPHVILSTNAHATF